MKTDNFVPSPLELVTLELQRELYEVFGGPITVVTSEHHCAIIALDKYGNVIFTWRG